MIRKAARSNMARVVEPLAAFGAAAALAAVVWSSIAAGATQQAEAARAQTVREDAYRANNVGVARLEQADFPAAVAAFTRALELDPSLALARLNLGIALFNASERDKARVELEAARKALPDRPQPDYMLGLIFRATDQTDAAIASFQRVLELDPADPGANVNLGQIYLQQQRFAQAIELFRTASRAEPYNATAAYGLATALVRSGASEGREAMEHFQRLRQNNYATTFSQLYLEQGRYAEGVVSTGAEPGLVSEETPTVAFSEATASMLPQGAGSKRDASGSSGVTLADLDGDGDLDLLESGASGVAVLRNDAGRFAQSDAPLPAAATTGATGVLAGDYDNDGQTDLLVLRSGAAVLLRRSGTGYADASAAAGLKVPAGTPRAAAWLDADHDGDLDVFIATVAEDGAAANRLYRNNGDGTFEDVTAASGLPADRPINAVVPTDYDNRRDVDVLLVPSSGAPLLFRNNRDGSFRESAKDAGLVAAAATRATVADANKDDYPDIFFARDEGPGEFAMSNGRGGFRVEPAPAATAGALAAHFLDYDSDGLLDLFVVTRNGPRVVRNLGNRWIDVSARAVPPPPTAAAAPAGGVALASGDLDGDGDIDVIVRGSSGLAVWRNDGKARSLRVRLEARVSNRSAIGSKVEVRAGSLRQRMETYSAIPSPAPSDVVFGVGARPGADVVRVLWPSGILQAEVAAADARSGVLTGELKVQELDRKPSSCPYLFTWNGERFEFVTDFLGGGEMGYWVAPGVRNSPDPDEYVRIAGDRLRARDGRYELRITNELEEAVFLDRVELVTIDHPAGAEVFPNEGLRGAPEPLRIHTAHGARPPVAASDEHGHDVLDALARIDRKYPDDFALERIRGYASEHTLTLTLPDSPTGRRVLLLTGWTDYSFSGDNVAAYQAGLKLVPPILQVADAQGRWHTAIENIGFPAGRPQTVPVDLTDRIPREARTVRIVTTMRIYWDQALVDVSSGSAPFRMTRRDPESAALRWRGFSRERTPDGREPFEFTYEEVSPTSLWKVLPGRYTREGDVRELLTAVDDRFVVSRPGDEVAVSFEAAAFPPLPAGWKRTFLLYANGFSKEMDLNSSSPDSVDPLPFQGMTRYPFAPGERRDDDAHREYVQRYNTRVVKKPIPPIETIPRRGGQ